MSANISIRFWGTLKTGVHVDWTGSIDSPVHSLSLERKGDDIDVKNTGFWDSITNATDELKKGGELNLVVSGKGVLVREIPRIREFRERDLVAQLLPQANPDDIYVEVIESPQNLIVALCKKETLEEITRLFNDAGLLVSDIHLGIRGCSLISKATQSEQVVTSNYSIVFREGSFELLEKQPEVLPHLDFGGTSIASDQVFALSAAFVAQTVESLGTSIPMILANREERKFKRLLTLVGGMGVSLLFLVVMINFMMFGHYSEQKKMFADEYSTNQSIAQQVELLKTELQDKEELIANAGVTEPLRATEYADKIGSLVPPEISLTQMQLIPTNGKIKAGKLIDFQSSVVQLVGTGESAEKVNYWVAEMRKLSFVQAAELRHFAEGRKSKGEFEVELIVK